MGEGAEDYSMCNITVAARTWIVGKPGSKLGAELLQAYLETGYVVRSAAEFVLRIGEPNQALLGMHRDHGVSGSAFVTAWNPQSQKADPADNHKAQAALEDVVRSRGWRTVAGIGQHPSSGWPAEESLLVLGPTIEEARFLGERFGQNAVVWAGKDAVPRLLVLR